MNEISKNDNIVLSILLRIILSILCFAVLVFSKFQSNDYIEIYKATMKYPEYNKTYLKISENLSKQQRQSITTTINNSMEEKYGKKIIVNIPTANRLIAYTSKDFENEDIIKTIKITPSLEFKKNNSIGEWVPANLTEKDIKQATLSTNKNKENIITIEFTKSGTEKFAKLTKSLVGEPLGIFYNNELITAPVIREAIVGGVAQITGGSEGFTLKEAQQMVDNINSSKLSFEVMKNDNSNLNFMISYILLMILSTISFALLIYSIIMSLYKYNQTHPAENIEKTYCNHCGQELNQNQDFCTNCGTKIKQTEEIPQKTFCNRCGQEVPMGQKFCGNCGNQMIID